MGSAGSSVQASATPPTVHQRRASAAAAAAAATGSAACNEVNIAVLRGRDNLLAPWRAASLVGIMLFTLPRQSLANFDCYLSNLDNRREKRAV